MSSKILSGIEGDRNGKEVAIDKVASSCRQARHAPGFSWIDRRGRLAFQGRPRAVVDYVDQGRFVVYKGQQPRGPERIFLVPKFGRQFLYASGQALGCGSLKGVGGPLVQSFAMDDAFS